MPKDIKNEFKNRFDEFADTECRLSMGSTQTGPYGGEPAMSEEAYGKLLDQINTFIKKEFGGGKENV